MAWETPFEKVLTKDAPLAPLTWLQLGGPAGYLAQPESVEQLVDLVKAVRKSDAPMRVLGGGSNVLVRDEGFAGVVICLTAPCFSEIKIDGNTVTAGGAASLATVINESVRAGLTGLDPLVGIPGTVGGALHCNSGSRGGDIGQWASRATVLTRSGEVLERSKEDLVFAYRESSLDELVILDATFLLDQDDPDQLTKRMQKQWIVKRAGEPTGGERTASIFKNPRGMSAGMLIDQAGLKGTRVGGCEVSQQHGNYFVAGDGATSEEMLKLIDLVRSRVAERLGVELETDLEIW